MGIVLSLANHDSYVIMPKKKNPDSNNEFNDELDQEVSKSALKRESDAKQKLGESLALLTDKQLDELELSDGLKHAVLDLKRLLKKGSKAHGGMKRQKQYIGKLMRHTDIEPIQATLDEWQNTSDANKALLHTIEDWRDRLLKNGEKEIDQLYASLQLSDQSYRQSLRQLIRQAAKDKKNNKAPKSARLLFKILRDDIFAHSDDNPQD